MESNVTQNKNELFWDKKVYAYRIRWSFFGSKDSVILTSSCKEKSIDMVNSPLKLNTSAFIEIQKAL